MLVTEISLPCDPLFDLLKRDTRFGTLLESVGMRVCAARRGSVAGGTTEGTAVAAETAVVGPQRPPHRFRDQRIAVAGPAAEAHFGAMPNYDVLASKFAPLLRFHPDERHFPGEPDQFRQHSRFRQSNYRGVTDRGWSKAAGGGWVDGNHQEADAFDIPWGTLLPAIDAETKGIRPGGPTIEGPVSRPRDERNLWDRLDSRGFFLELAEGYGRDRSGSDPAIPLSVFYDVHEFTTDDGQAWLALHYWFFYIYNWNVLLAHEGDWEHITLYFDPARAAALRKPECVFYAAHTGGRLVPAAAVQWAETWHPTVFVSRSGHPSYPRVAHPADYDRYWRTWALPIWYVAEEPWCTYCGAWGEVGELAESTGPLGPWFKRTRNKVTLSRRP